MTVNDQIRDIFSTIDCAKTLSENFPMNILEVGNGVSYDTPVDFIIDILKDLGFTTKDLLYFIIEKLFDISNGADLVIGNVEINTERSKIIDEIEDAVKIIIGDILTAILSCDFSPEIPQEMIDSGITLPSLLLDIQGILEINPTSEIGKCYYNIKNYNSSSNEDLSIYNLFQTHDLNAFIWNCIYLSNTNPEIEQNKTIWDNRNETYFNFGEKRDKDVWDNILSGKTEELKGYLPIMKLSKTISGERSINVKIDSHYNGDLFNNTLYKFNNDYLRSIRILEPKVILTSIINAAIGGSISFLSSIDINITKQLIYKAVEEAIENIAKNGSNSINDCYYSFSNEKWQEAMDANRLSKYGAIKTNIDGHRSVKVEKEGIISTINNVFLNDKQAQSDLISDELTHISRNVIDGISYDFDTIGFDEKMVNNMVMQIVKPFVDAVFTPQVLLLFYINFSAIGIIEIDANIGWDKIVPFIINKILSCCVGIIRCLYDKIEELLISKVKDSVSELMSYVKGFILKESTQSWLTLLSEAMMCLPRFGQYGDAESADYADITNTKNNPDSRIGLCNL